jgi:peptidylprolyl isomerase
MKVENGHNVQVHYKGTLSDGTEFDSSHRRGQPLGFRVGSRRMIPGFSEAVLGMATGETKSVTLPMEKAYGPRDPEALQTVPRQAFNDDFEFEVGGMIQGNGPRGPFLAKITEIKDTSILLDLNHPLAGEELNFEIELVSIEEDEPVLYDYKAMKKSQLFEIAKEQGLSVNTRSTKAQIINALQSA